MGDKDLDFSLSFGETTDPYLDAEPADVDQVPMPLETMAAFLLQDESEDLFGPDLDGTPFSGTGGGSLDVESGVLTLTFTPHEMPTDEGEPQGYRETTARFIEVEKLLATLASLDRFSTDDPTSGEWWRAVLAEKLDAHQL